MFNKGFMMLIKRYIFFILLLVNSAIYNKSYIIRQEDAKKIGELIWKNEMGRRKDELVFWSAYESFPSLGIGHQIWIHQEVDLPYTQKFPLLCDHLKKNGVKLPVWLKKTILKGAPWKTRNDFLKDTQRINELREILSSTIELQTDFMINELDKKWPIMLKAIPQQDRAELTRRFELMRSSLLGTYALVDYLNFKGDGLNPLEEINGHRWGLLQVLLAMPSKVTEKNIQAAFSLAASKILIKLIENSAPEYKRIKFLSGWIKRVSSYADKKILETV